MLKKSIFAISLFSLVLVSCKTSKIAVNQFPSAGRESDYINTYKDLAISEMKRTGIPASITLAQGMIESGNGKSTLATGANNHFGIKCHDDWSGPSVKYNDDRRNECFRKYKTAAESFHDHSDFLTSTPRYKPLFDLEPTDYKGWAKGLKKAGYATNPDYANMLIRKIEEFRLYEFDKPLAQGPNNTKKVVTPVIVAAAAADSAADPGVPPRTDDRISFTALPERVKEINRIQYIIVNERDTRESLEKEFDLLSWELPKYNDLKSDFDLKEGSILYLQPKRDRAEAGHETHIVKEGETMYSISQIYGIKLKKLYQLNRMEEGSEPSKDQKIWLRTIKPVY
jgi:LysM repeat protein